VQLPANLEAEKAVLGTVLGYPEAYGNIGHLLAADDFTIERHRRIWHTVQTLWESAIPVTMTTVASALHEAGKLEQVGASYLLALPESGPVAAGCEYQVTLLKSASIARRYLQSTQALATELEQGVDTAEVLAKAEKVVRELSGESVRENRLKTADELITAAGGNAAFFARSKANGIPTRWHKLNDIIGGLKHQQLVIMAARPGVGKTAAALDIAVHAAVHGKTPAIFSLEMSADDLLTRMACARSSVDWNRLRHDHLSEAEWNALNSATDELKKMPLLFDDTAACTVPGIHAALRKHMLHRPVDLVIVDYLQLLQPAGRHGTRNDEVNAMSRGLKMAAKEFDIPFLVLSQITRGPEKEERPPQLVDLRDSGGIEQDADVVIFIHGVGADDPRNKLRECQFLVRKQRNGPLGVANVAFYKRWARFEVLAGDEQ
jgi:replicative DNA helicase